MGSVCVVSARMAIKNNKNPVVLGQLSPHVSSSEEKLFENVYGIAWGRNGSVAKYLCIASCQTNRIKK